MAQRGSLPAPQRIKGLPGPNRGADKQLPVGAHQTDIRFLLATRQRDQMQGVVVEVTHATGQATGEYSRAGLRAQHRFCGGFIRPLQGGQSGSASRKSGGGLPQQQGIGQLLNAVGQSLQHFAKRLQHRCMPGVALEHVQVQFTHQQMVTHLQHPQQHAGQLLATRRARRLQQDVARGLQLVSQSRLLLQQGSDQCPFLGAIDTARRRKLVRLGPHELGQGEQGIGQHLHPIARVEYRVGQRGPDQIRRAAHCKIEARQQIVRAVGVVWHGHRKNHREHDGHRDWQTPLAPGASQKGDETPAHQQQAQTDGPGMQNLHAIKQGQSEQQGRQ